MSSIPDMGSSDMPQKCQSDGMARGETGPERTRNLPSHCNSFLGRSRGKIRNAFHLSRNSPFNVASCPGSPSNRCVRSSGHARRNDALRPLSPATVEPIGRLLGVWGQVAGPNPGGRPTAWETHRTSPSRPYSAIFLCSVLRLIPNLAAAFVCTPWHEWSTCRITWRSTNDTIRG